MALPAIIGIIGAAATAANAVGNIKASQEQAEANKESLEQQQRNIDSGRNIINTTYDEIDNILKNRKAVVDERQIVSQNGLGKYRGLVENYDPTDYIANIGTFNSDKYDAADYIQKNKDAIVQDAADKVQRSAAGAGIGRGTGAAIGIANAVADKNVELENAAYERMIADRNFNYGIFKDQYQANQTALDRLNQGVQTQIANLGGAIQMDNQEQDDYIADYLAAKAGRANASVNLLT